MKPHGSHKSLADSPICCYFHHMVGSISCGWRGSRVKSSQPSMLGGTLDSECIRNVLIFWLPCVLHTCTQHLDPMTFQCTSWHQSAVCTLERRAHVKPSLNRGTFLWCFKCPCFCGEPSAQPGLLRLWDQVFILGTLTVSRWTFPGLFGPLCH